MSRGLGRVQRKILKFFQEECKKNPEIVQIGTSEIINHVYNLDLGKEPTESQYQSVTRAIRRLDELGWATNETKPEKSKRQYYPEEGKFSETRYNVVRCSIRDGRISNWKTKQTIKF